jgi:hypothetical protein
MSYRMGVDVGGSFIHPSALRSYGLDVTYQF